MLRQTNIFLLTLILLSSFVVKTDNQNIQKDLRLIATYKQTEKKMGTERLNCPLLITPRQTITK